MNDEDWDVGSTGVILLPGTNEALLGGKSGNLYLMNGWLNDSGSNVTSVHISDNQMFDLAVWASQESARRCTQWSHCIR